jgi:hypothetical protein
MGPNYPNQVIYVCLFDLQYICAKYQLEMWFCPNDDILKYLFEMKNSWNKNEFCDVINKNRRTWFLFNNTYGFDICLFVDLQTICDK